MNASYQASLVNRHIRRFTGTVPSSNLYECFGRVWACLSQVGGSENQNAETLNFYL